MTTTCHKHTTSRITTVHTDRLDSMQTNHGTVSDVQFAVRQKKSILAKMKNVCYFEPVSFYLIYYIMLSHKKLKQNKNPFRWLRLNPRSCWRWYDLDINISLEIKQAA